MLTNKKDFDIFFNTFNNHKKNSIIHKKENSFLYEGLAAGLKKKDINIFIKNRYLYIQSKSNDSTKLCSDLNERILLSNMVDEEKITSSLNLGILEIKIPIKEEEQKVIKIS